MQAFRTLDELASAVDRNKGTVSRWTKRPDWPVSRKAPWSRADVPKILEWVEGALEKETTGGQQVKDADLKALKLEKLREEIGKIRANRQQAETALARERGELVPAADVEADFAAEAARVRNAMGNVPSQIVPLALNNGMPHQAAAAFQVAVEQIVNGALRTLSKSDDSAAGDDDEG